MMTDTDQSFGILGMEVYIPQKMVLQEKLETFDCVSAGKYTLGLGQTAMSFVDDREDIHSICLTGGRELTKVVKSLMEKYNICPSKVGRLEVGTETIIDKSKSVKSVLMQLFGENTDIEGVDTTNACYGGTNALFNSINWLESKSWDGRLAICVAADIAVYKTGPARPTGGAGAIAILLGPNAPLVFEQGLRTTHIEHVYDFYKPDLHSEYPEVDGPLSNKCYTKALDIVYNRYMNKTLGNLEMIDYALFHCPYTKLVQKSLARLVYNDFKRGNDTYSSKIHGEVPNIYRNVELEKSYNDRELLLEFIKRTRDLFEKKVGVGLKCATLMGNMYCGSVYFGLVSLLSTVKSDLLIGKRVLLFSYGSGLASSMFSLKVKGSTENISKLMNERLEKRTEILPDAFEEIMSLRELTHNVRDYKPKSSILVDNLPKGTYYLDRVDDKFRRYYSRT